MCHNKHEFLNKKFNAEIISYFNPLLPLKGVFINFEWKALTRIKSAIYNYNKKTFTGALEKFYFNDCLNEVKAN